MEKTQAFNLAGISLGDVLPFLLQLTLLEQQAKTHEGAALPYKFTTHTHGYTLVMEGTLKASKDP